LAVLYLTMLNYLHTYDSPLLKIILVVKQK
jgi:hypothetical protein